MTVSNWNAAALAAIFFLCGCSITDMSFSPTSLAEVHMVTETTTNFRVSHEPLSISELTENHGDRIFDKHTSFAGLLICSEHAPPHALLADSGKQGLSVPEGCSSWRFVGLLTNSSSVFKSKATGYRRAAKQWARGLDLQYTTR